MRGAARVEARQTVCLVSMERQSARITIPREVFWLCAVAPFLMAPLLAPNMLEHGVGHAIRKMFCLYLPFLGIPTLLKLVYDRWVPWLLAKSDGRVHRLIVHALVSTAVALVAGVIIRPVLRVALDEFDSLARWLFLCVLITWMFMLPTVLVEEHRLRAEQEEQRARREREAALEAQLAALSARTNPHFFFNSVNTVASLIPDDPELAEETLVRLAEILRYALEGSRTRFVPLRRELSVVRDYLEVQRARFGEKLRFAIEVDPAVYDVSVPPLFLQPLVENAVLHGVGQRKGGGAVQVVVQRDRASARIEVVDDGVGPGQSLHRGSGTALSDLEARLAILYGDAGGLESGPGPNGGFRVCVRVPMVAS